MEDQIRQESKAKKVIKIVIKLLYQILIIFCALLTAVIILQKISVIVIGLSEAIEYLELLLEA